MGHGENMIERTFPEGRDRPRSGPSTSVKPAPAEQGVILAIDDDTEVLNSIRRLLIREGWVVLTASDPAEGLRLYEEHWRGISLVLLDYYMPGLRGDEVWRRLKQINPQVRALLMTASDDYLPPRMLDGGQCGFVQKPAGRQELLQRIREALDDHDQPGRAPTE
jgi:two-component system, cell cycle sensor histidine kinase and response regulator CckA